MPKKWFWGEATNGSPTSAENVTIDDFHLNWAANLFGSDNLAGLLVWQAKDTVGSLQGIWTTTGGKAPTYDLVKSYMTVLWENRDFISQYHTIYNNDGFTVADNLFVENDAQVFTRKLGSYLIIYSAGPTQVTFTSTEGKSLTEYALDQTLPIPTTTLQSGQITVSNLRPNRLYVYRIASPVASVSAASYSDSALVSKAIVAAFGSSLAMATQAASILPLPTSLAGTQVSVRDSAGTERLAPLFFVSPLQVNYQIPAGTMTGAATVTITDGNGTASTGAIQVAATGPAFFTFNQGGSGAVVAQDAITFAAPPFSATRAGGEPNIITLYGTGLGADATDIAGNVNASVQVTIDGSPVTALYAGQAPGFAGLNQFNVMLPVGITSGTHTLILARNGVQSNAVTIAIK